jgi:hypothetical protein
MQIALRSLHFKPTRQPVRTHWISGNRVLRGAHQKGEYYSCLDNLCLLLPVLLVEYGTCVVLSSVTNGYPSSIIRRDGYSRCAHYADKKGRWSSCGLLFNVRVNMLDLRRHGGSTVVYSALGRLVGPCLEIYQNRKPNGFKILIRVCIAVLFLSCMDPFKINALLAGGF